LLEAIPGLIHRTLPDKSFAAVVGEAHPAEHHAASVVERHKQRPVAILRNTDALQENGAVRRPAVEMHETIVAEADRAVAVARRCIGRARIAGNDHGVFAGLRRGMPGVEQIAITQKLRRPSAIAHAAGDQVRVLQVHFQNDRERTGVRAPYAAGRPTITAELPHRQIFFPERTQRGVVAARARHAQCEEACAVGAS
jgi:hypothetical protein